MPFNYLNLIILFNLDMEKNLKSRGCCIYFLNNTYVYLCNICVFMLCNIKYECFKCNIMLTTKKNGKEGIFDARRHF